jgi:hypothetical protein
LWGDLAPALDDGHHARLDREDFVATELVTPASARLLGANEIFIADSLVTSEEQSALIRWAEDNRKHGRLVTNPRDPEVSMSPFLAADGSLTRFVKEGPAPEQREGRKRGFVWIPTVTEEVETELPEEFWRVRARVIEILGLQEPMEDPYKGSFLAYVAPGGAVHEHRDARVRLEDEEFLILRCNVLFRSPAAGGMPLIGSRRLEISDRGMWAFFPTEFRHSSTPVRGSDCRGTLSFGFLVRPGDLWLRSFRVAPGIAVEDLLDAPEPPPIGAATADRASPSGESHDSLLRRFVASQEAYFSVWDAARSLQQDPTDVWDVLRDLQASRLIQSASSVWAEAGRVFVFTESLVPVSPAPSGVSV